MIAFTAANFHMYSIYSQHLFVIISKKKKIWFTANYALNAIESRM